MIFVSLYVPLFQWFQPVARDCKENREMKEKLLYSINVYKSNLIINWNLCNFSTRRKRITNISFEYYKRLQFKKTLEYTVIG